MSLVLDSSAALAWIYAEETTDAVRRIFEIVAEKKIQMRDDYCIENYTNDPRTTPEDQLVTEILIPTV